MSVTDERPRHAATPTKELFGHPRGLTVLFLTETWEKFSYYGMRSILVYYMIGQLRFGQAQSSYIYGIYTASIFLMPLFGGMISDRWLTYRTAIVTGGLIMSAGHFMLTFPSMFFPGLAAIALGNGLYLPNLPSQITSLYANDDPRRISAYSVYYVGINIGSFLAPLVCGTLAEIYGWHWGFAVAGVGMVVGTIIYVVGSSDLPADRKVVKSANADAESSPRLLFLVCIAGAVVIFRGAYEQLGNTIALWAEHGVNRSVSSTLTIPMTWFQSLNPFFVVGFTPFLTRHWQRAEERGKPSSTLAKMAFGAALVGASYLLVAALALFASGRVAAVPWPWFALFFMILTLGELYILPVGLGLFGRSAPTSMRATLIGLWFAAGFAGNLMAGWLGAIWSQMSAANFFALIASLAFGSCVLLLMLIPLAPHASATEAGQ